MTACNRCSNRNWEERRESRRANHRQRNLQTNLTKGQLRLPFTFSRACNPCRLPEHTARSCSWATAQALLTQASLLVESRITSITDCILNRRNVFLGSLTRERGTACQAAGL